MVSEVMTGHISINICTNKPPWCFAVSRTAHSHFSYLSLTLSLIVSFFAASVFHFALSKCPANFNITLIKCEFDFYTINIFLCTHRPQNELYMYLYVNCHTWHFFRVECKLSAVMYCIMLTVLKPALNTPKGTLRTSVCLFLYKCSKFRAICMKMSTCQWEQCKWKSHGKQNK